MTRIKKLLLAGSMAVVTCCVSLSSSLINVSSLFARVKVNAAPVDDSSNNFNNEHNDATTVNGKIISASKIPTSAQKGADPVYIPNAVSVTTLSGGKISGVTLDKNPTIIIKNPYGDSLLDEDGNPIEHNDGEGDPIVELKKVDTAENPNSFEFAPAQIGTYTVQYAVQDTSTGIWTSSSIYKIDVSAEQFAIDFVSNDPIVMPDTIDTNSNLKDEDKTVEIALPLFYDGQGEQIKEFVLEQTENSYYVAKFVTFENPVFLNKYNSPVEIVEGVNNEDAKGRNVYEKYSTYQIVKKSGTASSAEYPYSVTINTKVSTQKPMSNNADLTPDNLMTFDTLGLNENELYNYIDCAYGFIAGNGLNIIDYRLFETSTEGSSSVTMPLSSISKSINGSVSYKKGEINLGASVSSNIRSSATSIGKKTYLPAVTTVNKNANRNALPAYYYYKVAYVDESTNKSGVLVFDDATKVVMGVDEGGVYFIPKVKGKFNVYYNAVDFYYNYDKAANSTENKGHTDAFADDYDYDLNVTDRTSPQLYLVGSYNYDKTSSNNENSEEREKLIKELKATDISYSIPTKIAIKKDTDGFAEIKIPAIYTEDNAKDFFGLTVEKTISSSNGFIDKDGKVLNNFRIRIQDGSSSNNSTNFSSSLTDRGIYIDDIVSYDLNSDEAKAMMPETYFYQNGLFYDKKDAPNATSTEISSNKLKVVDGELVIVKIEGEGDDKQEVVDTTKKVTGGYFLDEDGVTIKKGVTANNDIVKKLKTCLTATIKIDTRLFAAGDYTITFRVTDTVYANNTGDTFTFTLVDSDEDIDTATPEVKFTTATTLGNVGKDEKISIVKPKVSDDVDNRILTKYYVEADGKYLEIKLDENNKLTFNTSDKLEGENSIYDVATTASADKTIRVIALAYDDFADYSKVPGAANFELSEDYFKGDDKVSHIGYAVYPISVKYVEDELAPIITEKLSILGMDEQNFNQGDKVLVNGIKYYDNTSNAFLKSIKVVDSKGNTIASQSLTFSDFKSYIDSELEKPTNTKTRNQLELEVKTALSSYVKKVDTAPSLPSGVTNASSYLYEYYFPGISFIATEAQNYTITYEICDMGTNNVTVFSFVTTKAIDTEAPVISGISNANSTLELGETYYISNVSATDNSTTDVNLTWEVKGAKTGYKNNWFSKRDDGTFVFTPQEVDVYTITVTAVDEKFNSSSKSFVVTVKDTQKPTVELNTQYPQSTYASYLGTQITISEKDGDGEKDNNGVEIDWANSKLPSVNLPGFSAKDKYQDKGFASLGATGTLTIKTPDDSTYVIDTSGNVSGGQNEIKLKMASNKGINYFTFTPTKRGHYTATYSAKDLNGNSAEKDIVREIYIGDTEVPVIYLTGDLQSKLNNGFVVNDNNELVINPQARIYKTPEYSDPNYNVADLYVEDNYKFNMREGGTGDNKYNYVNVSISVTNENNSTVKQEASQEDGLVRYKFDTAGTYTITFTVTDECGNTGTFNRTFKVTKDKASTLDTTKIVGIVLIVVSVLILGGVVIYFVKGTKFLPKRKKKVTNKPENKEPTEKQE